jgi:uncharacterized cupredoxin-like copper-binding protein
MEEEARMSWRGSGNFRGSGSSKSAGRSSSAGGSVFSGGSAGGPPLIYLIGAAVGVGVIALIIALSVGALSGGGQTAAAPVAPAAAAPAPTAAPAAQPTAAPAAAAGVPTEPVGPALATGSGTALEIGSDGDKLAFNKATLDATAGTVYSLTLKNNATAVQHNWVLVSGDVTVADAVEAAATAAMSKARNAAAAIPPADTKGLLVAMPIINAGTSSTVTFKAPAAGTYTFLCTFPGHYAAGMVGQLVVK